MNFPTSTPPNQATHVVADLTNCYFLNSSGPLSPTCQADLLGLFGITCATLHDIMNVAMGDWRTFPAARQDIFFALVDHSRRRLHVTRPNVFVGFDPHSSTVIRDVALHLGGYSCSQWLAGDTWDTPFSDMLGQVPPQLYHGTSDIYWQAIKANGLILTGRSNWNSLGAGKIYLAATPQIAANHARRTATGSGPILPGVGGNPIVIEVNASTIGSWDVDYDVEQHLVLNPIVPCKNIPVISVEAGLWATTAPIPPTSITCARTPMLGRQMSSWPVVP